MKSLLVVGGVFGILVLLVKPVLVLNQLLRARLFRSRFRFVSEQEVPGYISQGLAEPIAEVEALGFQRVGWMAVERERPEPDVARFYARLFDPATGALATVGFAETPDSVLPWRTMFCTHAADGRVIQTLGGGDRSILGEPPGTILVEPYALTAALEWEAHRAAVRASGMSPVVLEVEPAFTRLRDRQIEHFEACVRDGRFLPVDGAAFVLSWSAALRTLRPVLDATKRLGAQRAARLKFLQASLRPLPAIPVEADAQAYGRILELSTGTPRKSFLVALFALSVPLFLVALAYQSGAAVTAAIVFGVVLFHELGHFLAMRAVGYQDTTIFFVPFFGGVAAGRKDDATVAQRLFVLLAGPMPGLLIALVASLLSHRPWPHGALSILVGLNLFNLLPILPLDGGQIAHLLLFARRPWLDVAFRALAGVGLILVGWQVSGVFLPVIGLVTLVQLPKSWRQAVVRRQFGEALAQWPDVPRVQLFFRVLGTSPLARLPFAQKFQLARTSLAHADSHAPIGWGRLFGYAAAYAVAFVVGGAALVFALRNGSVAEASVGPQVADPKLVSSLACPANADGQEESARANRESLAGVAVFDSREALEASRGRLATAGPGRTISRAVGPALLVWTVLDDGHGEYDEDTESNAKPSPSNRIAAVVTAAGGRFHNASFDVASGVGVDCSAPDESTARAIEEEIGQYVVAARAGVVMPAPWAQTEVTDAQREARRTFHIALAARDGVKVRYEAPSPWSALTEKGRKSLAKQQAEHAAQKARAVEAALAAERARGPIDEEVARLALTWTATSAYDERQEVTDALRVRLGGTQGSERVRPFVFATKTTRAGTRVHVKLGSPRPHDVDRDVRPMLSWLCAKACVDQRLFVEPR